MLFVEGSLLCSRITARILFQVGVVNRWDEKAGLRTGCGVRSQVIDVLEAQIKRRPAMKKVSTAAAQARRNVSQQTLTVGLDLGDRNSWYWVRDEAGQIQLEQRAYEWESVAGSLRRHTAQPPRPGDRNAFALDQSLAQRVGARSDRGECAQGAADRGKPQKRRSSGCADAGPAGKERSTSWGRSAWTAISGAGD